MRNYKDLSDEEINGLMRIRKSQDLIDFWLSCATLTCLASVCMLLIACLLSLGKLDEIIAFIAGL